MSRGLLAHILKHAREEGWVRDGSIVLDCFGGIFTTGILGAYENLNVVGIELEQRFVDLANENIKLHARKWEALGCPIPVILQGDSRKLCEVVAGADIIVSSPPYISGGHHSDQTGAWGGKAQTVPKDLAGYGKTEGQLGAMKPGQIDTVISSPPYSSNTVSASGIDKDKLSGNRPGKHSQALTMDRYGQTPGNLGNLKPGSVDAIVSKNLNKSLVVKGNSATMPLCKHVKIVENQLSGEVTAVNPAHTSTLAKSSRVGKSHRDTPNTSRQQNLMCPCQTVTDQLTHTGRAATNDTEDLPGLSPSEPPKEGTGINADSVVQSDGSMSTISSPKKKQAENGTTPSITSKHFVPDAISRAIGHNTHTLSVPTAARSTKKKNSDGFNADARIVNEKQANGYKSSSIINRRKHTLAKNAEKNSDSPDVGGSIVAGNALERQEQSKNANVEPQNFWEAARDIVTQCHQILKPGGHAIWVVKSFIRKGKRVDFPGDWRRLCESVGLKTVCEHHAMLVKETRTDGLFGEIVEKKERKSFFRRLAEARGSPPIDWEVVICGVKPKNQVPKNSEFFP